MTNDVPTSRGFFGYGCDALAGISSALILAFALAHPASMLVLLAYFAAIPLFIVGFAFGPLSGLIAAVAGTAGLLAAAPVNVALFYLIADSLPAVILVYLALVQRADGTGKRFRISEGALLTSLLIYPCAIFLGVYALTINQDGGLMGQTLSVLTQATDQVSATLGENGQTVTPEMMAKIHEYIELLARFTPATAISAWLLVTILAVVAAQGILQPLKRNLRPAFTLEQLRLPNSLIYAALVLIAASFAPRPYDYVAVNLAVVLAMPFFFTGLAVVHAWAATTRSPMLMLVLFYIFIAYLLPLVAVLGAVDQWGDFRKKFANRLTSKPTN